MCRNITSGLKTILSRHDINIDFNVSLLFLYHAEVRYALQLRHLSNKTRIRYWKVSYFVAFIHQARGAEEPSTEPSSDGE